MFDKIEAPKRKRGERGEETTQDLIVKKYSAERMKELEQGMKEKFKEIIELNKILDKLNSSNYDENYLRKLSSDIQKREQQKKDEEIEYKKWLSEREMKLSQISMKFRAGTMPVRQSAIKSDIVIPKEEQTIGEKIIDVEKEKLPESEILGNTILEDNNNAVSIDSGKSTSRASIVQNQAAVFSPKTENNSEEYVSDKNKNEDIKPTIENDDKSIETSRNNVAKRADTSEITAVDVESDSASSS
ncbi:bromodomain-containing 8-like protein, partial [Euroglyphus maynei]